MRRRVVVTGMGKSGHIARKIAATLASTGTPAFFLHPAEASHGDLGMIAAGDCVLAISRNGESPELADILHHCARLKIPLIAMTCGADGAVLISPREVVRQPGIRIRWTSGLPAEAREAAERAFTMTGSESLGDDVWSYRLEAWDEAHIAARPT